MVENPKEYSSMRHGEMQPKQKIEGEAVSAVSGATMEKAHLTATAPSGLLNSSPGISA